MSRKANIFRGPALWTLIAGLAIGAGSMYSVVSGHGGSLALAQSSPVATQPAAFTKNESLDSLKAMDSGLVALAQYASPAVVLIKSESNGTPGLNGMSSMARQGEGSGVIFRPDGYIVTNDHVVAGFDKVTVVLKDGREFPGKVTRAPQNDIAVVKIDASNLPTLKFADSSKVLPGQLAMAIGAPYGLENSVTIGHVSALNRQNDITDPMTGITRVYPELIQTDAAINMGNSGGPLIDIDGNVIGINSSIVSPNGGGVGIGFAISANQAKLIADTLIEKGKVTRAFLGLLPEDLKEIQKQQMHVQNGALVTEVESDGPAAAAGVKVNDVIVKIGNIPVTDQIDLRNAMLKYAPGTTVDVDVVRDGSQKSLQVKLTAPPKAMAQNNVPQRQGNGQGMPFGGPQDGSPDIRQFLKEFGHQFGDNNGNPSDSQQAPSRHFGQAQLGVQIHDIDGNARSQFHIPSDVKGAVVVAVVPGSVADKLGMKVGDVLQNVAGKQITSAQDVRDAMNDVQWGDTKRVSFSRYGQNGVYQSSNDVQFH